MPDAQPVDRKLPAPAVVAEARHGRFVPGRVVLVAILEHAHDDVMAVREAVGLHRDRIADHALDRKPTCIDDRRHVLDREARVDA